MDKAYAQAQLSLAKSDLEKAANESENHPARQVHALMVIARLAVLISQAAVDELG